MTKEEKKKKTKKTPIGLGKIPWQTHPRPYKTPLSPTIHPTKRLVSAFPPPPKFLGRRGEESGSFDERWNHFLITFYYATPRRQVL